MLPVISVNACVVANPSLLFRFMSCSSEDPLPGRSAALSGQLVIESFYSSLRVAVIVCPLRAADLPESGQLVIESFYGSLRGATYNIECRLSAEGSGPPGKRTSWAAEPWRPLRLCERKLSTRTRPFFIFSR